MRKIITVVEAVEEHFRRCAKEARKRFGLAVRPLYVPDRQGRPEVVASAVLVEIEGTRFLATAAHVRKNAGLHLGCADDLIPLPTDFEASLGNGADDDNVDIALAILSNEQLRALEGLPFVGSTDQMHSTPTESRYQLAMGYRASQNKAPTDSSKNLKLMRWSFTGFSAPLPQREGQYQYGEHNFALEYSKRAVRENGERLNTTPPIGISGGPIFDLGSTSSFEQLCSAAPHPPRLAGIVIECPRRGAVLIGTKAEVLRNFARRAKAQRR